MLNASFRSLIGFFGMVALSGTATILSNGVSYWDRLFLPWQDFWILASGVFLVQFAYSFPRSERSLEFTLVRVAIGSLVLLALAYCIFFGYRFLFHWTPGLTVDERYYLLLPIGVLFIVIILLRRSVYFCMQTSSSGSHAGKHNVWRNLIQPQDTHALVFRNLALALSLAFLPALQIFLRLPDPSAFIISNIGSILAIVAIALIYFNYAPEVNSFMGKLVGITLTTILLILAIYGSVDIYLNREEYYADYRQSIVSVYHTIIPTGELTSAPDPVAYVVSWDASNVEDIDAFRQLYPTDAESNFDLAVLAIELVRLNHQVSRLSQQDVLVDGGAN
jgi:hypothetical protein